MLIGKSLGSKMLLREGPFCRHFFAVSGDKTPAGLYLDVFAFRRARVAHLSEQYLVAFETALPFLQRGILSPHSRHLRFATGSIPTSAISAWLALRSRVARLQSSEQ